MKLYVELYFDSSGADPLTLVERMKDLGFEPVIGEYDFEQEYDTPSEYGEIVDHLTDALDGTGAHFRLITRKS